MYKVLVTGATGFIGRSLVPALILAGHNVKCAVSKKNEWLQAEQVIVNNLQSTPDWSEALQDVDVVIHLAAKVHVMTENKISSLDTYCTINAEATKNLAEQAAQYGVKRFIFMSTIKVNGESTLEGCPFTESCIAKPDDPYALSKLQAERHLFTISENTTMDIVILRPPLVIGPGVRANFLKMLKLVNKGWPLPFKRVNNKRSFVFIDNLISAICTVTIDSRAANQIYLVADDDSWSLSDLLVFLAKEMNINLRLFCVPGMLFILKLLGLSSKTQRLFGSLEVNNNKLKSQLGWVPPVSSADGLAKTVKWYQNEYNS